jgi:hypothetical protein
MSEKATATDAELILKLYDMRREAEMRKARSWFLSFWPESSDDYLKVGMAMGTQENAWLRQVTSYWEMVGSLVLHGAINRDLFLEPSISAEMFVVYCKIEPFLKDLREKMKSPTAFSNIEKVVNSNKETVERLKGMQERMAAFRKMAHTAKAS